MPSWFRKILCWWDENHIVEHWEYDEGGKAQARGRCMYCGKGLTLTAQMLGKHLCSRTDVLSFAERCSRFTCPNCGGVEYTMETAEDAGSTPEYLRIWKRCVQCSHTWGEVEFVPQI